MLLSLILIVGNLFSQIQVSKTVLDYGKVAIWKNDTLVFWIQNNNATPAKLLPTYNPTTLLIGPHEIAPGQKVTYKIVAYPSEKGNFEFRPSFFFSNSNAPIILVVKGAVNAFDDNALFQCPKLENTPTPAKSPFIKIKVIDENTGKPIYHSNIIVRGTSRELNLDGSSTEFEGLERKYTISVSAEGYNTKIGNYIFTKSGDVIVVQLKPVEQVEDLIEEQVYLDTFIHKQADFAKDEVQKTSEVKDKETKVLKEVPQTDLKRNKLEKLTNDFATSEKPPQHIIILADVSFSMKRNGYLEELKTALKGTMETLRPIDSVSLITFSTANVVLSDHVSVRFLDSLNRSINAIQAQGGTNAKIALKTAYGMADRYYNYTQIFLFTDGKFNAPGTSVNWYAEYAKQRSENKNYKLNIILFSNEETDYLFMQQVAFNGNGNAFYINKWGIETLILEQLLQP